MMRLIFNSSVEMVNLLFLLLRPLSISCAVTTVSPQMLFCVLLPVQSVCVCVCQRGTWYPAVVPSVNKNKLDIELL